MMEDAGRVRSVYDFLARSREVRKDCGMFRRATGLSVMLVPTDGSGRFHPLAAPRHPLCELVTRTGEGLAACQRYAQALQADRQHHKARPTQCLAGLTELAVPVIVNRQPVAMLLCGQVLCEKPTDQDFERVWNRLRRLGLPLDRKRASQAYFQTRVVAEDQVRAAAELLGQMAERFAESASRWLLGCHASEPACVRHAKELAPTRLAGKFTTHQAAAETSVSPQYFCHAFKVATGMTFTAYVTRLRIDRAKQLLADPDQRIADIGFAVGFGSLPHFGRVFKRYDGMTASAYRRAVLPGENPATKRRIPA